MTGYITWGLIVNVVFLGFHPAWASFYPAVVQSLGINLVIFIVPAVPFLGTLKNRDDLPYLELPGAMLISFALLIGVLGLFRLTGRPLTPNAAWNGTCVATNLMLLISSYFGVRGKWRLSLTGESWRLFFFLFFASYGLYFYGAIYVVPEQEDHDLEVQATGYGLLTRFEPLLLTDRNTIYYFAHPPLLHYYAAASFLYYGQLEDLEYYDAASQRALAVEQGRSFKPPMAGFRRGENSDSKYIRQEIVGVKEDDYVIVPPLPDGSDRIPVRQLDLDSIYEHYTQTPHKIETRTPNIFLASLTVALLGCWAAKLTGPWGVGLFVAAAYATSPEVFVRSSYGGYFAIGNFALLLMLMATARQNSSNEVKQGLGGFAAGWFAAWSDHKLVLFPLALFLWQALKTGSQWNRNVVKAAFQPVVTGFAVGTVLFWVYGSLINPSVFWLDHVRTHLFDRMLHYNPLGYSGYPNVFALWIEFWQHTGYLLLPLGLLSLYLALISSKDRSTSGRLPGMAGLWSVYILISALVFSWADWRMTKHLMLLMPVLYLAPLLWTAEYPRRLVFVSAIFLLLLTWNIYTVLEIANNFAAFHVSPDW